MVKFTVTPFKAQTGTQHLYKATLMNYTTRDHAVLAVRYRPAAAARARVFRELVRHTAHLTDAHARYGRSPRDYASRDRSA